ncbi:TPA: 50S ribosomal protein L20 [Candidatus Bathyarchaeota archaeon]|nr:50S ribosomal protein L20 [Candidatus Bathyarchaeota archaeon]
MTRVKGGPRARKRHKKVIKAAKGYRGTRRKLYKRAKEAYLRAGQHAYVGRKLRKRDMRRLWVQRINAALSERGLPYSKFIKLLKDADIELDRKILAQLVVEDPGVFAEIVETVNKGRKVSKGSNVKSGAKKH